MLEYTLKKKSLEGYIAGSEFLRNFPVSFYNHLFITLRMYYLFKKLNRAKLY